MFGSSGLLIIITGIFSFLAACILENAPLPPAFLEIIKSILNFLINDISSSTLNGPRETKQ